MIDLKSINWKEILIGLILGILLTIIIRMAIK